MARKRGMSKNDVSRLLDRRQAALEREGQRLIHKRPPDPRRRWRTYDKPGPVTIRKVEP